MPKVNTKTQSCSKCLYYDNGYCYRNPPQVFRCGKNDDLYYDSAWPMVSDIDWCGQWESKNLDSRLYSDWQQGRDGK